MLRATPQVSAPRPRPGPDWSTGIHRKHDPGRNCKRSGVCQVERQAHTRRASARPDHGDGGPSHNTALVDLGIGASIHSRHSFPVFAPDPVLLDADCAYVQASTADRPLDLAGHILRRDTSSEGPHHPEGHIL